MAFTYLTNSPLEQARKDAAEYTGRAVAALDNWGEKAIFLKTLAQRMLVRVQ